MGLARIAAIFLLACVCGCVLALLFAGKTPALVPARQRIRVGSIAAARPEEDDSGASVDEELEDAEDEETGTTGMSLPQSSTSCRIDLTPALDFQFSQWRHGRSLQSADVMRYCVRNAVLINVNAAGELRFASWLVKSASTGSGRFVCGFWLIQTAVQNAIKAGNPIPPFELALQSSDGSQVTYTPPQGWVWDAAAPLFGNIKCNDHSISLPVNFHDQFGSFSGAMSKVSYLMRYQRLRASLDNGTVPWAQKIPKLFWSSGRRAGSLPSERRGNRPDLIRVMSTLEHASLVMNDVPISVYGRYQFQVYAHGRCGWSRRLHELAMIRAVVFVEISECSEYFLELLKPHVHYIPVAKDFSDLAEKLAAAIADPKGSEAMADRWFETAPEIFRLPCVLGYVEAVLRRYAGLFRSPPQTRSNWGQYLLNNSKVWSPDFLSLGSQNASTCPGFDEVNKIRHRLNC